MENKEVSSDFGRWRVNRINKNVEHRIYAFQNVLTREGRDEIYISKLLFLLLF